MEAAVVGETLTNASMDFCESRGEQPVQAVIIWKFVTSNGAFALRDTGAPLLILRFQCTLLPLEMDQSFVHLIPQRFETPLDVM